MYCGKALLAERPQEFARLLALQVAVLGLDMLTLYCAFRALNFAPHPSVIILGYSLANLLSAHAPLPGGGGTFEATMVLSAVRLGVPAAVVIGATLIYRVLTFWLPGLLTAAVYRRLLGGAPHA
jgi:uncharacterized protein (TIRG00374 family)